MTFDITMTAITADDLITQFNLKPHPEGGYFSETYRSIHSVVRAGASQPLAASTAIYYGIYPLTTSK